MWEVLSRLDSGDLVAVISIVSSLTFLLSVVLTKIVVGAWQRHRDREVAAAVIEDMLEQGLSPDQVVRVLMAGGFDVRGVRHDAANKAPCVHRTEAAPDGVRV